MLLSMSSYRRIFVPLGTVMYFFILVYSLYCDLKGVDSNNTPNTSERPVITVLQPGYNKFAGAPLGHPVLQTGMPSTNTLSQAAQAAQHVAPVAPASAKREGETENYYVIPDGK